MRFLKYFAIIWVFVSPLAITPFAICQTDRESSVQSAGGKQSASDHRVPEDRVSTELFFRLIERAKTAEIEEKIASLEGALRLEPQLRQSSLPLPQKQLRGWMLNALGIAYQDRIRGSRADNIEAAIKALEAALTIRTRDALPQDWAATQNNLGTAYWERIIGGRAENMETAIKAFEAALTV